jgi:hypothetical protein
MPQEGGHFDCAYVAAVEPEVQVELAFRTSGGPQILTLTLRSAKRVSKGEAPPRPHGSRRR